MASLEILSAEPVDPRPDLPVLDIGEWSLEKHALLRRYVDASREARRKFRRRAFIDLFSGPGRVRVRNKDVETDGGALVAWRASVATGTQFTEVVIGDIDEASANACKARLEALHAPVRRLVGPASETVKKASSLIDPNSLSLAYLDPFNLDHLPFGVIRELAALPRVDIVVHFSVMDLQRELELDFERDASRLEVFAPGWRSKIDPKKLTKSEARSAFVAYWLQLVAELGFSSARQQPLMTNSKNGPLYRMMFLMRHRLAEKLWNDIAKPPQGSLF